MSNVLPLESELDKELGAIKEIWKTIEPLKLDAKLRIVAWLQAKVFEADPRKPPGRIGHGMLPGGDLFGP